MPSDENISSVHILVSWFHQTWGQNYNGATFDDELTC